jgi:hypothetical protein
MNKQSWLRYNKPTLASYEAWFRCVGDFGDGELIAIPTHPYVTKMVGFDPDAAQINNGARLAIKFYIHPTVWEELGQMPRRVKQVTSVATKVSKRLALDERLSGL